MDITSTVATPTFPALGRPLAPNTLKFQNLAITENRFWRIQNMAKKATKHSPKYWLFKSEADCYSIDDLAREKNKTTFWDGVRNYQARNMLRDEIQPGDKVAFYHSNSDPLAIVGICEVVQGAYPDHTAFDPNEKHYDPKSKPDNPSWFMVDIKLISKFKEPVTREQIKTIPELAEMVIMQKGSRLSVTPVTPAEWKVICRLGGIKED